MAPTAADAVISTWAACALPHREDIWQISSGNPTRTIQELAIWPSDMYGMIYAAPVYRHLSRHALGCALLCR